MPAPGVRLDEDCVRSPEVCQHAAVYAVHGWFVLRQDAYGDTDFTVEDANAQRIRAKADTLNIGLDSLIDVRQSNGMWLLTLGGYQNRPRGSDRALDEPLQSVGELLPGSYGILYESDDERVEPPGRNAFRVRVMVRGTVSERADPFLSPIQPKIE